MMPSKMLYQEIPFLCILGSTKKKVTVSKDSITIQGTSYPSTKPSENDVLIEYATLSTDSDDDSATLFVTGSNFKIYNINITNLATGSDQAAVAVSSRGKNNAFYACGIHGDQGTFYAHIGSLFVGRSYIEGSVDFVYGRTGNAWFQGCKLGATRYQGTITAQGRQAPSDDGAFVFDKAKIVLGKNAGSGTKGSVYLGRPWGDYARVVFQNSNLGDMITPVGWQAYTISQSTRNVLLGEYSNTNAGGIRVLWAKTLSSPTDISSILPKYKGWVDSAFIGASFP
ncbi:hypothetical protein G7Y89_g2608 [Cudoniella acicularis]|uniref:pectinesterase n=1 Tax=Cudoniella acicularis TaxID=354080 RepID=A0A8H4RT28_9HELO|nr:hypothetical protein G7Y89_g2608 [Cudoniella acicularis]